jgi:uncharacterized protein (TIGR02466 family)
MPVHLLFPTPLYQGDITDSALIADLAHSARSLAAEDSAGRRWCRENAYPGYTSYASLNDLQTRDPAFALLAKRLAPHVRAFADAAHMDLGSRRPRLDSLGVNILKPGGGHTGHIHPHCLISGTFYVEVPPGAGALKIEDPRLQMMMAAPGRTPDAPAETRPFFYVQPAPGAVLLWESWLRHEVPQGRARAERISVSFNYA